MRASAQRSLAWPTIATSAWARSAQPMQPGRPLCLVRDLARNLSDVQATLKASSNASPMSNQVKCTAAALSI